MAWRIEQAVTGRSRCKHCSKTIAKGEQRFGNDEENAFWYHLACAPQAKPGAFKPFAAEAAKLAKPPAPKPAAPTADHADLVAKLRANPEDPTTRGVYADWLQSQGNPLGEVIALELAGKADAAKKLFKKHVAEICGGYSPKIFDFKGGFIDVVRLDGTKRDAQRATLEAVLVLPAAVILRDVCSAIKIDASYAAFLTERMPPTATSFFTWLTNAVGNLSLPHVTGLGLYVLNNEKLDVGALGPLIAGTHLPRVRRLRFPGGTLDAAVVIALLESPFVQNLEWFEIDHVDNAGAAAIRERKANLAKVEVLHFRNLGAAIESEFPAQHEAWMERANEQW